MDHTANTPPPLEVKYDLAYFYVLNLFSGSRRPNDIQQHLESKARDMPIPIIVLSIDAACDAVRRNLADTRIVRFWLSCVQDRKALVAIGGPPCETWTAARLLDIPGSKKQPRPLRDSP